MKKLIITLAIVCAFLFSINANAQDSALAKGDNIISATVGFGSFTVSNIGVPPISISYENIVHEFSDRWNIGVGGFAGFFTQKFSDVNSFGGSVCAQSNVHFCPTVHWDIYAGLGLGLIGASVKSATGSTTVSSVGFAYTAMLGARYFFTEKFGVNFQLGGIGIANAGVSFKF